MTDSNIVSLSAVIEQPFFFDLETKADPSTFHLMPEPTVPKTYKDPVKIAAYIEKKKQDRRASAALDPDHGRILSIGIKRGLKETPIIKYVTGELEQKEAEIISWFWRLFERSNIKYSIPNPRAGFRKLAMQNGKVIELDELEPIRLETIMRGVATGWGIRRFDFPFLLKRSFALGIKIPMVPSLKKWTMLPILDLQDVLHLWEPPYKGLKYYTRRYGLQSQLPDITGADVATMSKEEVITYQMDELDIQARMYQHMAGVYWENELHIT